MAHDQTATPDDDTSRCGLGFRCEQCGAGGPGLRVVLRDVFGQTFCLTSCARCAASDTLPPLMVATVLRLIEEHARHVAPLAPRVVLRGQRTG